MTTGLNISVMPFNNLKFVGVLLFKEYPSTVVFSTSDGIPMVLEWVDFIDETNLDRFFIFESNLLSLKNYIDKRITHLDLIKESQNGVVVFFDNSIENPCNMYITGVDFISTEYLPSSYNYFDAEDSDDFEQIKNFFRLDEISNESNGKSIQITELVRKVNSELFHIHLNNGKHISHGRAQTDILGNTLIAFEELYYEIASDLVRGVDRVKKVNGNKAKASFERIAHTEVVISKAASYSIYLRPISNQLQFNVFDEFVDSKSTTPSEKIFQDIFELVNLTEQEETIQQVVEKYNHNVFVKLKQFAQNIKKSDLDLDLEYYSPLSHSLLEKKNMNMVLADSILTTLSKTSITSNDKFDVKGKFTALNCNTGHFSFISYDDTEYSGYFDKLVKGTMPTLNFVDIYNIRLERNEVKNIADSEFKFTDKILAILDL